VSILSTTTIEAAIAQGLTYLVSVQQPAGGFVTYTSPRLDLVGGKAYPKTVYLTTYVIHALCYLRRVGDDGSVHPPQPLVETIQQRAADFLSQEQEENGAWCYEGRDQQRIAPDLDDTACATAALFKVGRRPALSFYQLLWQNEVAPGGPYYTLIGPVNDIPNYPHARQVNAQVNANIVFCAGLLNLALPGATSYLQQIAGQANYQTGNFYYVSPHFFCYTLSRAYADGGVEALALVAPAIQNYLLHKLASASAEPVAFHLACVAASLLNLGLELSQIEPYLVALLARQTAEGNWPAWAAQAGYAPNYDGGPALTTALALEALGKYLLKIKA
jgi:hypothetical protein